MKSTTNDNRALLVLELVTDDGTTELEFMPGLESSPGKDEDSFLTVQDDWLAFSPQAGQTIELTSRQLNNVGLKTEKELAEEWSLLLELEIEGEAPDFIASEYTRSALYRSHVFNLAARREPNIWHLGLHTTVTTVYTQFGFTLNVPVRIRKRMGRLTISKAARPVCILTQNRRFLPVYGSDFSQKLHICHEEPCLPEPFWWWYLPSRKTDNGHVVQSYRADCSAEERQKTTVFITVDTEDDYFDTPLLITGDGVDPNFALPGILDRLESRNFRASFFVNVYGHVNYADGLLADIAREIDDRGHDVELHAHQNRKLDFYRSKLFEYDLSGQKRILDYGQSLLQRWCGNEAVAFRAGGFQFNNDTLSAIKEVGCRLDSSYIFGSDRPKISTDWVSAIREHNGILEVPVTYTPIVLSDGTIKHAVFDLNALRFEELSSVMRFAQRFQVRFLTFIMHSFSLIDKVRRDRKNPPQPEDKEPILRSRPDMYSGYVDIFGTRPAVAERFERFLDLLRDDPNFEVKTFRESLPELEQHVSSESVERLPILYR